MDVIFSPLMSSSSFLFPFVCSLRPSVVVTLQHKRTHTHTRIKLIREKKILDRKREKEKKEKKKKKREK
jgi:hypothetical protein